ncbi:MAG: hypothetical protein H6721_19590 [Sandaracinus sp.]|nr:hypothetical protein [Myxococcales bacterium]MCB9617122.1 hypothetical protein [Sandaracinus sp.]MCB9625108.1 hypothetical protein [Sandaracinus sp.]MCB9634333.1 hypothetical protein [Sandaracinus sp.]
MLLSTLPTIRVAVLGRGDDADQTARSLDGVGVDVVRALAAREVRDVDACVVVATTPGERLDDATVRLLRARRSRGSIGAIGYRLAELRRAGIDVSPERATVSVLLEGSPSALICGDDYVLASNVAALPRFVQAFVRAADATTTPALRPRREPLRLVEAMAS